MSYQFHIGQKVVCINGWQLPGPQEKKVYTISWIGDRMLLPFGIWHNLEGLSIRLKGFGDYSSGGTWWVHYYNPARFRPLVKTDISIFEAMLVPVNGKVEA
jgi:hypothetical protein